MKTNTVNQFSFKLDGYSRFLTAAFALVVGILVTVQVPARAQGDRAIANSSEVSSSESWDEEDGLPRRFIQWPRVTIGLVWSDPASGQMKVMDLGSAPEDGQFTPDVLMSRCMRAAGRLSPEGRMNDAFSGASTRTLQPLTDAEIEALLHENSSRK